MLLRTHLQTTYSIPRRKITSLIDAGAIFLNQEKVQSYQATISPGDQLRIPELKIQENYQEKQNQKSDFPALVLFHKPVGYTCSKADPHNPTFYELLPLSFKKYYYIGRLDKESRGLILLTSDPKLVHEFEHPSKHIIKEYQIQLDKPFDRKLESKILAGIKDQGELLRTLRLYPISASQLGIVLNEGKKRHIRRIFKLLGYQVIDLLRIRIANYKLNDLAEKQRKKAD